MVEAPALDGVRVLDLTRSIAGPWTTRMLADAGAEVIKLEPPNGDFIRQLPARIDEFSSGYFLQANAGKRSICIDLQTARGRELLESLIPHFDIVMHNMRPNAARRLGLIAERVHDINPMAIFCQISGYGSDSAYVNKPGQDLAIQCMTGVAELSGIRAGEPAVPVWSLIDTLTSAYAYTGICSALLARLTTGRRRIAIEVAMSQCSALLHDVGPSLLKNHAPTRIERSGQFHPFLVLRGVAEARDGFIAVSAFRNRYWDRIAPLLGFDGQLLTSELRRAYKAEIESRLEALIGSLTVAEATDVLRQAGVPCGVAERSLEDVAASGIFQERGMLVEAGGGLLVAGMLHRKQSAQNLAHGAPALGEATFDVLHGVLGLDGSTIMELLSDGVISCEPGVVGDLVERCSEGESAGSAA